MKIMKKNISEKYKNHENLKISLENHENLNIQREKYENHENHRIPKRIMQIMI